MASEFDGEVYIKLAEAEREAAETDERLSPDEVLAAMREAIAGSSATAV